MTKPPRLEIYSNDIQQIKNCSSRRAREILKDMKEHYNKKRHQIITPDEAARYLGIKLETLIAFLFSFLVIISPIISQTNYWSQIRYFSPEEFYVNGEVHKIDPDLVLFLDEVRHKLSQPIVVTSGVRSKNYNKIIGGASQSDHSIGKAVDLKAIDSSYRYDLLSQCISLSHKLDKPIKVILYDSHIHLSLNTSDNLLLVD